jgi:acetylornithine/succinyldiaminopimelate/putrescine aminotransferase
MAKPLANGIPVGAIMMKDGVADVVKLGDHGTTFGWVCSFQIVHYAGAVWLTRACCLDE